jgi:transposase
MDCGSGSFRCFRRASPAAIAIRGTGRSMTRAALAGIVFMLQTGINWTRLPTSLAGCSGVTCWRRLRDWTEAGVWPELHELLLAQLRAGGGLNLDRCAVDGFHVRALTGGTTSAPRRSTAAAPAPSTT